MYIHIQGTVWVYLICGPGYTLRFVYGGHENGPFNLHFLVPGRHTS
jgi:hypothetical protein